MSGLFRRGVLTLRYFLDIGAWCDVEILFEKSGKIMNGAKTKHICDFTDRILVFPDQLFAFLQFDIEQIVFW